MLIEVHCKDKCGWVYMNDLSSPKECPNCKSQNIWWTNDEAFDSGECIQAVELGDEDE